MGFSHNRKLFGIDTTLSVKPFQFQLVGVNVFGWFVCLTRKSYGCIFMKSLKEVGLGKSNIPLDIGEDRDQEIFV